MRKYSLWITIGLGVGAVILIDNCFHYKERLPKMPKMPLPYICPINESPNRDSIDILSYGGNVKTLNMLLKDNFFSGIANEIRLNKSIKADGCHAEQMAIIAAVHLAQVVQEGAITSNLGKKGGNKVNMKCACSTSRKLFKKHEELRSCAKAVCTAPHYDPDDEDGKGTRDCYLLTKGVRGDIAEMVALLNRAKPYKEYRRTVAAISGEEPDDDFHRLAMTLQDTYATDDNYARSLRRINKENKFFEIFLAIFQGKVVYIDYKSIGKRVINPILPNGAIDMIRIK